MDGEEDPRELGEGEQRAMAAVMNMKATDKAASTQRDLQTGMCCSWKYRTEQAQRIYKAGISQYAALATLMQLIDYQTPAGLLPRPPGFRGTSSSHLARHRSGRPRYSCKVQVERDDQDVSVIGNGAVSHRGINSQSEVRRKVALPGYRETLIKKLQQRWPWLPLAAPPASTVSRTPLRPV